MFMLRFEDGHNLCEGVKRICIIVRKKNKGCRYKKRKKINIYQIAKLFRGLSLSSSNRSHNSASIIQQFSMPELNKYKKYKKLSITNSIEATNTNNYYRSEYVVNVISEYPAPECLNTFNNLLQTRWRIYRCQLNTKEETCCCSCNSDAMFEVMKSLYDCYKKKNCDHCNCILCGHLPKEERRLGEIRKSVGRIASIDVITTSPKEMKKQKLKKTKTSLPLESKTEAEREKAKKVEAADILVPLEGKTPAEKEKILKKQAEIGVALPEGRSPSEKALIQKIKTEAALKKLPSAKIRKAKEAGLLTPLQGKTPEQKEKILRGLAMHGIPLPEGKTASEKKLIKKVRKDVGLPPEPKTPSIKEKYKKAMESGIITPLEGKSIGKKEKILKAQADLGIPLPEGRTPSEKKLIAKVKAASKVPSVVVPSEKIRRAKTAGLLTPLTGKTPEQKEKILKGLAIEGIPLPEPKTPSEKKLLEKIRTELGLPPEPKTEAAKEKYKKAMTAGIITPLEGKTPAEKEKILKDQGEMGLALPEGRTQSEKALIAKVKASVRPPSEGIPPSEKLRKAKAAGILTPLEGKTPEQKEKILKGLAMHGLPLPLAKTPSNKKIFDKVRNELGLPPEPKTAAEKEKYEKAQIAGFMEPLEGKTPEQKEKILKGQTEFGIPLPEGRTPSEKALIANVKKSPRTPRITVIPSEKLRKARAAGFLTPLEGKTPAQKENILKGLAMHGIPLPEGKSISEKKIIDKVRTDLGLPPEPKTASEKDKYNKGITAGVILPLEGKTPAEKEKILNELAELGIPLPEGRTSSEKKLIKKIKVPRRKTKTSREHTLSPEKTKKLDKKTAKNIKEGKGPSDECICHILTSESEKLLLKPKLSKLIPHKITSEKLKSAKAAGLLTPLAGKTPAQKEKILKGLAKQGLPLPEGKTVSEKRLIDKVRADMGLPPEPKTSSAKANYAKAQAAGIITPLEGKTANQKEKILREQAEMGLPLPEGRTPSEKALINKVKKTIVPQISSERLRKAKSAGLLTPLQGKTPEQKEKILKGRIAAGLPLPKGETSSEKELIRKVKAATGYVSPKLEGKTPSQKEKILRSIAKQGLQLPEGKTSSEKALISKVKASQKLPSALHSPSERLRKAKAAGLLTPLEGKTAPEKEKILKRMHEFGLPLPEGRTPSEKSVIRKIKTSTPSAVPSEKLRAAKAAGLLTPLSGKTPAQREKILKGLAKSGIPLPEGKTASEKELINKVKKDMGLPQEPKSPSLKEKLQKAYKAGLVTPLEGKTPAQKQKILKELAEAGAPLPEGRTSSEKALIKKVQAEVMAKPSKRQIPSDLGPSSLSPEKRQKLDKKTAKLMKEGKGPSDECLCSLLTPKSKREVKTPLDVVLSEKLRKVKSAELSTLLAGKTPAQREKIIKDLAIKGRSLPKGKTASEKKVIDKVRAELGLPPESAPTSSVSLAPVLSEKLRQAKAAGLLTPLEGKTPAQKEKLLKDLAFKGLPLPEGKTTSEKKLIDKVRDDLGLPPEPKTPSEKNKYNKALEAGAIVPLQGKTPAQKNKILRKQAKLGIPLPKGRTHSEKALINNIKADIKGHPSSTVRVPSEKIRKAKEAGLLTPLDGKTPAHKEKILKDLAMEGLPLPEGKTTSEKKLIDKVRDDLGLPPEPKTPSEKNKYNKALEAGVIAPLEGKTPAEKNKILQSQAKLGIPLPKGRTYSEKALINNIKADIKGQLSSTVRVPSEKIRKAKEAGLLTPLNGKTPAQKEKILKDLAMEGLPLPEGKTASEKKLIDKVRDDLGLPPEPKTPSEKNKYNKALEAGAILPLEGKTAGEKDKILRNQAKLGIPLPKGRTHSEKALINSIKADIKKHPPSTVHVPSEKIGKAKEAGLLTPLEGKTPAQKEKILKGLAETGVPLPEGRTPSEKALINKVKAESKRGVHRKRSSSPLPKEKRQKLDKKTAKVMREGKGPSDECICSLLTPESSRDSKPSTFPKEKKSKGLTKARLSTSGSKKQLVKRDRKLTGLSPKRKSSEKVGKIRTKSKKVGAETTKKSGKSIGAIRKSAGIVEEFQDVLKTTTCDRGCGCDKKKIRFKHSYVKIRVTSPDISSLCPCPDECIPGVKSGVLTDNEGIKVTVGRAIGVPPFSFETPKNNVPTSIYINDNFTTISTDSIANNVIHSILGNFSINPSGEVQNVFHNPICPSRSDECHGCQFGSYRRTYNSANPSIYDCEAHSDIIETDYTNGDISETIDRNTTSSISIPIISKDFSVLPESSFESIYLIKTESSLSLTTQSRDSIGKISMISLVEDSAASHSSDYLYYSQSETFYSDETAEEKEYSTNQIDYSIIESEVSNKSDIDGKNFQNTPYKDFTKNTDVLIFRMSGLNINNLNDKVQENKRTDKPVLIINDLHSEHDIRAMVDEIISNKLIRGVSSVFIVVASYDDVTECSEYSSSVYIQMSDNISNWNNDIQINDKGGKKPKNISTNGLKINTRGKPTDVAQAKRKNNVVSEIKLQRKVKCERFQNESNVGNKENRVVSVDTACDKPCYCKPKRQGYASSEHHVTSVVSELVNPMIMKQGIAQGLNDNALQNISNSHEPRLSPYGQIQVEPTPVTSCIVPPCSGRNSCHDIEPSRKNITSMTPVNRSGPSRPCHCRPHKCPELMHGGTSMPANNISLLKTYGTERVPAQNTPWDTLDKLPAFTPTKDSPCATCGHLKFLDGKRKNCFCSGKEKKVRLEPKCPCQVYDRLSPEYGQATKTEACQYDTKDSHQAVPETKDTCICRSKKKRKKNITCECPEIPDPEEPLLLDSIPWIDEKQIRKMQSDLTQTTSGFKMHTQKRTPPGEEMSYEDIMNYYNNFTGEDDGDTLIDRQGCDCETSRKKSKDVDCECPYEPPPPPPLPEPAIEIPIKGLKFRIGAKGSGSKGLSGICCFDMLYENKKLVKFQSISHLS